MENLPRLTGKSFDKKYFSSGSYKLYEKIVESWIGGAARAVKKILNGIKNPSVLDAGCAHGYLIAALQNEYGMNVRGLEYSKYAVKAAVFSVRKKIRQGNITDKKLFKKNSFDAVVCLDVFSHLTLPGIKRAAENLVFWTKKYVVFSTIYRHSLHASQKINPDPLRITTLSQKEYKKIFTEAGGRFFKKIDFRNGGAVFIFRKK